MTGVTQNENSARTFFDLYRQVLAGSSSGFYSSDDDKLGSAVSEQIIERDRNYSKLLKSYLTISRVRNWLKEVHKWILFWGIVIACVWGFNLINRIITPILDSKDVAIVVEGVPVLVTALVAFISAVIGIPMAVVKFLFNTKEDDNITDIIKHTQEHDAAGRAWIKLRKSGAKLGEKGTEPKK